MVVGGGVGVGMWKSTRFVGLSNTLHGEPDGQDEITSFTDEPDGQDEITRYMANLTDRMRSVSYTHLTLPTNHRV